MPKDSLSVSRYHLSRSDYFNSPCCINMSWQRQRRAKQIEWFRIRSLELNSNRAKKWLWRYSKKIEAMVLQWACHKLDELRVGPVLAWESKDRDKCGGWERTAWSHIWASQHVPRDCWRDHQWRCHAQIVPYQRGSLASCSKIMVKRTLGPLR